MRWRGMGTILPLLIALSCGDESQTAAPQSTNPRGLEPDDATSALGPPSRPVDWSRSAGVFIGVQKFHDDSDLEVPFAADDAVDLAWLFTHETNLLPPERTALLLAGRPSKDDSRRNLAAMRHAVQLVEDGGSALAHENCLDAKTIADVVRQQARSVGPDGILVVSFATHGLSHAGEHRLLTADASSRTPYGVVLASIIETIETECPGRLLLLIDACRNAPSGDTLLVPSPMWQSRIPMTFLEDVNQRLSYAVLVSATPGTTALADDGNGYFTRAILDGLRCNASHQPDGYVTLSNLATYVSERVTDLSDHHQQTESRIGGLGPLQLVRCVPPPPPPPPDPDDAGEIIAPKSGDEVDTRGIVRVHVYKPEQFLTILVCAPNNVCYNQNPEAEPLLTHVGEPIELTVQYGAAGRFTVKAALTADRYFLRGVREVAAIPDANRLVYWCKPVEVTATHSQQEGGKQ